MRALVLVATLALTTVTAAVAPAVAPAPAQADEGLRRYYQQDVEWKKCQLNPSDETGAELDRAGARCADFTVPLDYRDPGGRTITVAVSRLKASDTARRIGALLLNGGGPGGPSVDMPLGTGKHMKETGKRFDLIGMDPRFVGRSSPLDCAWPTSTFVRAPGRTRADFDRTAAFQRDLARRCRFHADVLPHVTTRNTVRDMDVIRGALGERRLSYLGYSYGSYLGMVYTQMFPDRADRVVLDGVVDPRRYGGRLLVDSGPAGERALRDWAGWAAARHGTYGLGRTADAVVATVRKVIRASGTRPLRVGDQSVDDHVLPLVVYIGLVDDRDGPRTELAQAARALHDAARNGHAGSTPWLAENIRYVQTGEDSQYASVQTAILCGDVAVPRDPDVYWREIQRSRRSLPTFGGLVNTISPCSYWGAPVEEPAEISNDVPALLVASTGDTRTVYEHAQNVHGLLSGSRLVTLADVNTHGTYGEYGNACVDGAVNAYLASGVLPARDQTCR